MFTNNFYSINNDDYNNFNFEADKNGLNYNENDEQEFYAESIKKYFIMYYRFDVKWISQFVFLKQLKPQHRNAILKHTFEDLILNFNCFFGELEENLKYKILLNLETKILERNQTLIIEADIVNHSNGFKEKKRKYIYLIIKGKITIYKENISIIEFSSGSYFGDFYLISEESEFTYKNNSKEDVYLFAINFDFLSSNFKD